MAKKKKLPTTLPEPISLPGWLGSLDEETRERVFVVMRAMRDEQTRLYESGRVPYGQIAVGGACADDIMLAELGRVFLKALGLGKTPEEASAEAFEDSKVNVRQHNTRRTDITWQRWEGSYETQAKILYERIMFAFRGGPPKTLERDGS